jgi:hypothetical protein
MNFFWQDQCGIYCCGKLRNMIHLSTQDQGFLFQFANVITTSYQPKINLALINNYFLETIVKKKQQIAWKQKRYLKSRVLFFPPNSSSRYTGKDPHH